MSSFNPLEASPNMHTVFSLKASLYKLHEQPIKWCLVIDNCCNPPMLVPCAAAFPLNSCTSPTPAASQHSSAVSSLTGSHNTKKLLITCSYKSAIHVWAFASVFSVTRFACMYFRNWQVAIMEWQAGIYTTILCDVQHVVAFVRIYIEHLCSLRGMPCFLLCSKWQTNYVSLRDTHRCNLAGSCRYLTLLSVQSSGT